MYNVGVNNTGLELGLTYIYYIYLIIILGTCRCAPYYHCLSIRVHKLIKNYANKKKVFNLSITFGMCLMF